MADGLGIGFYDDMTRTCRVITPTSPASGAASVPERRPPAQDPSWFILDDRAGRRYVSQAAFWRFSLPGLFAGCGGKVDLCSVLEGGLCRDTSGSAPIKVEEAPPFSYDLAVRTRAALELLSAANPCLLYGLNGVSFLKMKDKADYQVNVRLVQIDPTQAVTTVEQHWLLMRFRLYHELGHHIFEFVLPTQCDELQTQFVSISWDDSGAMLPGTNPNVDTGDFLNGEAVKNADEDFAVCMAYYFVSPSNEFRIRAQTSPALARKYDFINSLLRGNEY